MAKYKVRVYGPSPDHGPAEDYDWVLAWVRVDDPSDDGGISDWVLAWVRVDDPSPDHRPAEAEIVNG